VLLPATTLGAAKIKDGSKVMLMSSKGGVQSAGQAAAAAAAADKERKLAAASALLPKALDNLPNVVRRSPCPQATSADQVRPDRVTSFLPFARACRLADPRLLMVIVAEADPQRCLATIRPSVDVRSQLHQHWDRIQLPPLTLASDTLTLTRR